MTNGEITTMVKKMRQWLEYYDTHERAPSVRASLSVALDALDIPEGYRLDPFISIVFENVVRYNADS